MENVPMKRACRLLKKKVERLARNLYILLKLKNQIFQVPAITSRLNYIDIPNDNILIIKS